VVGEWRETCDLARLNLRQRGNLSPASVRLHVKLSSASTVVGSTRHKISFSRFGSDSLQRMDFVPFVELSLRSSKGNCPTTHDARQRCAREA